MFKEEIIENVMKGATGEYSHVLVVYDHYDHECGFTYVKKGDDVEKIINNINRMDMTSIKEVYNYSLNLEEQFNEYRAYHIEPKCNFLSEIKEKLSEEKFVDAVEEAFKYALSLHSGQVRKNGVPYITHPIRVSENVIKYKKSHSLSLLVMCALLHDVLEDTDATYYDLINYFGTDVASIVKELTADTDMKNEIGKEKYLSIKMKNMSSWALVIKLCDRLDNINDLNNACDVEFKSRYINETIGILDYLINNGNLSKTHLDIIGGILDVLFDLCYEDVVIMEKLNKINDGRLLLLTKFVNSDKILKKEK